MSKIQVSAKMKIIPGMLDEFKQQAAKCISVVKDKDSGTLQYDWFLSSDKTECEIRETYESSEAFLIHVSNLREPLRILFEKFASDHSVVIYGEPSPELLENAKARRIDVKVFSFLQGLNHTE
jgi:quinol monooxygenase YgiN